MPLKTEDWSVDQYPQLQLEELKALSVQISEYVAGEQWEQLVVALDLRQQCIEALFSEAVAEPEALKSLARSILEQDAVFVARIQEQKKIVEKQILALDKGRHAINAYGSS
ncbi:flagellar protein FliT [Methylobacter sp.]|uniref:flagellar protein FliT n=1 Tax=Methylobacter sp. TaxID=2051955 RepID=UPI001227963D|nr:flagellar protein FliT [Methylobacter sp.]TAK63009.1 MAG: flagellar protein FliT [Methylobacter sp.]